MSPINMLFSGTGPLVLFLAKATLLLVAALVATASLRRSTAGARHLVWLAALVGVLALPLLSRIPSLRLGVLPSVFAGPTSTAMLAPVVATVPPTDAFVVSPAVSATIATTPSPASSAVAGGRDRRSSGEESRVQSWVESPAARRTLRQRSTLPGYSILSTLAIVWTASRSRWWAGSSPARCHVRRIVSRRRELTSPDWTTPLCEVADRLDLEVPPRLVMSDRIEMAFACRALDADDRAAGERRGVDRRSAPRRAVPRAGARQASRSARPHARPARLRAVLVPSARLDRREASCAPRASARATISC